MLPGFWPAGLRFLGFDYTKLIPPLEVSPRLIPLPGTPSPSSPQGIYGFRNYLVHDCVLVCYLSLPILLIECKLDNMGSTFVLFTAVYSWHADSGQKINRQKILARANEKGERGKGEKGRETEEM